MLLSTESLHVTFKFTSAFTSSRLSSAVTSSPTGLRWRLHDTPLPLVYGVSLVYKISSCHVSLHVHASCDVTSLFTFTSTFTSSHLSSTFLSSPSRLRWRLRVPSLFTSRSRLPSRHVSLFTSRLSSHSQIRLGSRLHKYVYVVAIGKMSYFQEDLEINGSINYSPSYTQPKLCSNDQAIMEIALESDNFMVIQLQQTNCVQMYLGFTYINELCHPHGRGLHPTILSRARDAGQYQTTLSRPHQPKPNTRSWLLWERVLRLITQAGNKTLKHPLGPWTRHHSMAGLWQSYQVRDTVFDFAPTTAQWIRYTRRGNHLNLEASAVQFTPKGKHTQIFLNLKSSTPLHAHSSIPQILIIPPRTPQRCQQLHRLGERFSRSSPPGCSTC